jgi:hypothetical protein
MHTTTLAFPLTVLPRQKPASAIRVLPEPQGKRIPGPALNRPQSRWTVVAAFALSVLLHVAAIAIVEMDLDRPPADITRTVNINSTSTAAD